MMNSSNKVISMRITEMRKIAILALILVFSGLTTAQELGVNDTPEPEPSDDFAQCGDGICQPQIQGVCPQDCGNTSEQEDNSTNEDRDEPTENKDLIGIALAGFTGLLIIAGGLFFYSKTINSISSENEKNGRNRELERELRKRLRQGQSYPKVEKDLINQGRKKSEIEKASKYIDRDLIQGNDR